MTIDCYSQFFDIVYQLISNKTQNEWTSLFALAEDGSGCQSTKKDIASRDRSRVVRQMKTTEVLDFIGTGRKVVFVDAREESEFDEYHIPGAVNLTLRQVTPDVKAQFEDADLVIGYCIKDFRGFEIARALAEVGVENVAIMNPYGIAGWRAAGLPIAGVDGLSEEEALDKLDRCAQGVIQCL